MSIKITKVYVEALPALRFIGKRCLCHPQDFVVKWDEWLDNGWFEQLIELGAAAENGDAYLGATNAEGDCFWIGMLFPIGTHVPDGFAYEEIPAARYAVFEMSGIKDEGLLGEDGIGLIFEEMSKRGMIQSETGMGFERYTRPVSAGSTKRDCAFVDFLIPLQGLAAAIEAIVYS
jgi:predicted transcriptional regulator YdeE